MAGVEAAAAADDTPACDDSACSTPFVSAPSSPTRDRDPYPSHFFFSAPTSPTRGGGGGKDAIPGALDFDFDFDFSSRFPSPSAAAMSSADELFHNGQIRLAAALLQPHPDPAALLDFPDAAAEAQRAAEHEEAEADADERGRVRTRSLRRKARSMSPFRTHWRSASHVPAATPVMESDEAQPAATPAASRSSSSSSTASSASSTSSSSSRGSRRWGGFLRDLLHRSKSDGGKTSHSQHSHSHGHAAAPALPTAAAKTSASPPSPSPSPAAAVAAAAKGRGGTPGHRGGRRRSAHERLYEARRAEAEEMRRRTSLPYRQGLLLFGCIGLGNRSYGAVHGLARGLDAAAAAAVSSRS